MKTLITVILALSVTGCGSMYKYIPSFWDDNQSQAIVDVRLAVQKLDCAQPHLAQAQAIKDRIDWFVLYSESKGRSQQDVVKLVEPMKATVDDFHKRSLEREGSKTYCELKKKVMIEQAQRAAGSVLGRW